jgi:hypothetical protein
MDILPNFSAMLEFSGSGESGPMLNFLKLLELMEEKDSLMSLGCGLGYSFITTC